MELVFVRHGQAEHNLDVPDRLERIHPKLTEQGREQVRMLRERLAVTENDLFVAGPSVRTVETSILLTRGLKPGRVWISPLAGPRMFPQNPEWSTLPCDIPLTEQAARTAYPALLVRDQDAEPCWRRVINDRPKKEFIRCGTELLDWIRKRGARRTVIVSHDGTINAYRELLGERHLERQDFLGEAGAYSMLI